jgi:hypothetical protein
MCVRGATQESVVNAFEDLEVSNGPDGLVMVGQLADQAALFGILTRIRELGLELISTEVSEIVVEGTTRS